MAGVGVGWTWSPALGVDARSQDGAVHATDTAVPITADTVVEITTRYVPSAVDSRSPHAVTKGTGASVVNGVAYAATWSRPTPLDPSSSPTTPPEIPVDTGRTFLEFVRAPGG